jgi:hypothetical protein
MCFKKAVISKLFSFIRFDLGMSHFVRLILFFFLSISLMQCKSANTSINNYKGLIESYENDDYQRIIKHLKLLEKNAINKNYYLGGILFFSNKINDKQSFQNALDKVNLADSFFVKEEFRNNYTVIENWRAAWLHEIAANKNRVDSNLVSCFSMIQDLEIRHRSKLNAIYRAQLNEEFSQEVFKQKTDSIFKLQAPLDSMSHALFDRVVDSLGRIPCLKEVGTKEVHIIFIVMQHYKPCARKERYIKMLKKEMLLGYFPSSYYAQIVDRNQKLKNKPLKFGMTETVTKNGKTEISGKIKNLKKLNLNRINYGLGSIL